MKTFLLFAICGTAFAQLERPRVGMMLDADGNARVVYGVDASVTVSEPVWKGVLSLACSNDLCVAKTETALVSSSGQTVDAPGGPAILTVDDASVYAYFPDLRQLFRWQGGVLDRVSGDSPQPLPKGAAVFAMDTFVRLVRSDGTELTFPISGVTAFFRMSDDYVQLTSPTGMWALRVTQDHEQVFLLPGGASE